MQNSPAHLTSDKAANYKMPHPTPHALTTTKHHTTYRISPPPPPHLISVCGVEAAEHHGSLLRLGAGSNLWLSSSGGKVRATIDDDDDDDDDEDARP
jgi:hypothetical protein